MYLMQYYLMDIMDQLSIIEQDRIQYNNFYLLQRIPYLKKVNKYIVFKIIKYTYSGSIIDNPALS